MTGYGSQAFALNYLGANYTSHKIVEWAIPSIIAYADAHSNDTTDYSKGLTKQEIAESEIINGKATQEYTTTAKDIDTYKLTDTPKNATGTGQVAGGHYAPGRGQGRTGRSHRCYSTWRAECP